MICGKCESRNVEPAEVYLCGDCGALDDHDCSGGPEDGCAVCAERFEGRVSEITEAILGV